MLERLRVKMNAVRKLAYEGQPMTYWPLVWIKGKRTDEGDYRLAGLADLVLLDRWHFQAVLAHYPTGASQPPHVDNLKTSDIYRCVIVLKKGEGGELVGSKIFKLGRLYLLRPDKHQHEVTPVTKGERLSLLLSLYKTRTQDVKVERVDAGT